MKNSLRGRALAQTIARIHWSIADMRMDASLTLEDASPVNMVDLAAAMQLVEEALQELRDAYRWGPVEKRSRSLDSPQLG